MTRLGLRCALHDCGADVSKPSVALLCVSGLESELDIVISVLRETLGQIPLLEAHGSDIAYGLARLIASEAGEAEAAGIVSEVLPASLGLLTLHVGDRSSGVTSDISTVDGHQDDAPAFDDHLSCPALSAEPDLLFERATKLPASTTRNFLQRDAAESGDLDLVVMQRGRGGTWKKCQRISGALTTYDDEFEAYICEAATWSFELDSGGLLTATPQEVKGGKSPSALRRESRRRWIARLVSIMLLLLLAFSGFLHAYSIGRSSDKRIGASMGSGDANLFRKRIVQYLQKQNPGKISEVDSWLVKYHGREDVLVKRLEKKYGARFPDSADSRLVEEL